MKVLIATDGSVGSFVAIHQVCRVLSPQLDEILLYYSPPKRRAIGLGTEAVGRGQQAISDAIFDATIQEFPPLWRDKTQRVLGSENPRTDIAAQAEKFNVDILVVGARGLGMVNQLLLGSVSRSVVHSAKVPVLVARSSEMPKVDRPVRVLLACENKTNGTQLAECLGRFTWPDGSICRLLTAIPSVVVGDVPNWLSTSNRPPEVQELISAWVEEERTEINRARDELEAIGKMLPAAFETRSADVKEGHVANEIIESARTHQADFIVMGSRASTALNRLFIGSACEAVLNRATCSVLVVPINR